MRIAVMGAGAVGGYFGGLLAQAGNEVVFIARGQHLKAIQARGLTVRSHHFGEFVVKAEATSDTTKVGQVDLVLFSVKTYHNATAVPDVEPMVGPGSSVLTLQNGVESCEQLAAVLDGAHILPGAAYIEATIESPGVIVQRGEVVRIVFGEPGGPSTPQSEGVLEILTAAGIEAELSKEVMKALWTKLLFIVALAGPTSAARAELVQLLDYPEGRQLVMDVLREAESVGRARGIALDDDVFERTMSYIDGYAKDLRASMHKDLELDRPLELEALNGAIVRLGQGAGVPVPANECIYALLKPHLQGAE